MKLLIASDIHGSAFYAKKVVESFEKEEADKLLLLGDILYHGPRNDLPFGHILLCGHTHVPKCVTYDNYIYMNPGSTSLPKENSHNGYMIYENKTFIWKDFDDNIKNSYSCQEA